MRTRWNPKKQGFELIKPSHRTRPDKKGRGNAYKGKNNLDYKGPRSHLNVLIPDEDLAALRAAHRAVQKNISLNDYMSQVIKTHLETLNRKTEEVYDYSDPDLTTLQETFYYQ